MLALREVTLESVISWPVADWTLLRRSVTQNVLFELYCKQTPSLTALKLATTARAVVCERENQSTQAGLAVRRNSSASGSAKPLRKKHMRDVRGRDAPRPLDQSSVRSSSPGR